MAVISLATLPLQLVCHLIVPQVANFNNTDFANSQSPLEAPLTLPSGAKALHLGTLPLELVCQLLATRNPGINEHGTLVEVQNTTQTPSATLPDGYVRFPQDGAAYKIYEHSTTWDEAREQCISEGGRLAITDSRDKIKHINTLKRNSGLSWGTKWLHVGIHRSNTTDEWLRADNDLPLSSVPWAQHNPDGAGKCAGISYIEDGLVDYACDWSTEYYVCEILISED